MARREDFGPMYDSPACLCDDSYDCYGDCRDCRNFDETYPACQNMGCEHFRSGGDILCSVCLFR